MADVRKRVAVVGAGMSGLPAIKQCLEEGLKPVCFELRGDLGGLWNYDPTAAPGLSTVMQSTIANTCKETYCYSDFPAPDHSPVFMPHEDVLEYLRMYARQFDLERHICYHTEVVKVTRASDFNTTGRWDVTVKDVKHGGKQQTDADTEGGTVTETFDGVLVCNGHHGKPHRLPIEGADVFKGGQLHSIDYRNAEPFRGQRVLVVGIGNSAVDIACELSRVCKQVWISTRRGAWLLSRLALHGRPFDLVYNRQWVKSLLTRLPAWASHRLAVRLLEARFDHALFGLQPTHGVLEQNTLITEDLPGALVSGKVRLRGDLRRLGPHSAHFEDGSSEDQVDAVIYATGYELSFPFLEKGVVEINDHQTRLYKFVFPPDLNPGTLAIIGCIQPYGSILAAAEMHARWATRVIKGVTALPDAARMLNEVEGRNAWIARSYLPTRRHRLHYDWVSALDEVAEEIGCKPNISRLWFTDPRLACSLYFGPTVPFHYRLSGPGSWPQARKTILTVWDRIAAPMRTGRGDGGTGGYWGLVCAAIFIALVAILFLPRVFG